MTLSEKTPRVAHVMTDAHFKGKQGVKPLGAKQAHIARQRAAAKRRAR